jgi:hypothetical protein
MNQIKIALVLIVAMFVLLVVGGVTPTLAGSPNTAPPTVVLPTPVATQPKPAATTAPAGKAPTRAVAPATAPTRAATVAVKAPKGVSSFGSGTTDLSSFQIQNIDSTSGSVTVTFYDANGTAYQPTTLNGGQPNPFTLNAGTMFEVYTPAIPSGLPNGQYSVVISANVQVAAIASMLGQGTVNFNGTYDGLSAGASPFYLPAVMYNFYGWYDIISVQNVGSGPTDVTVSIVCDNGTTGTLQKTGLAQYASVNFDLYATPPSGWTGSTSCNGSAQVTTTGQPVVAIDNERAPTAGNMQSYNGVSTGATKLYASVLFNQYYGWFSSINILKIDAGTTTVTVTYSDGGTSTCNLTDAQPGCLLVMGTSGAHPAANPGSPFAATMQTNNSVKIVSVINAANGAQAQTYTAVAGGTRTVAVPAAEKSYYNWFSSVTCQNVGSVATTLNLSYSGYSGNAYNTGSLGIGATLEKVTPNEAFLPSGYQGGLTITANDPSGQIACIVNTNNPAMMSSTAGDWSTSTNAFNK